MRVYRGTTRETKEGRLKLPSWTPSLAVAAVYSARPGDVWGDRPASFVETSTVHVGELSAGSKVLSLCNKHTYCSFDEILDGLEYGQPNGITEAEARKILNYMHNRLTGRAVGGEFLYVVLDEDGNARSEDEIELSFVVQDTLISLFRDDFDYEGKDVAWQLGADAFIYADAPAFKTAARRLGYDAVSYSDVFAGGVSAVPELLHCDVYRLDGVKKLFDIEDETVPAHETLRPLHAGAIVEVETVSTTSVLPDLLCTAPLKARLLR